jgi:hypothetical protein
LDLSCRIVSYSDAAETASVRPILSSARASSSGVTTTEGDGVEVDGEVMAELIQIFVSRSHVIYFISKVT